MQRSEPASAKWSIERQERLAYLSGLLPALLVLVALTLAPAIYLFVVSLTPGTPTIPG